MKNQKLSQAESSPAGVAFRHSAFRIPAFRIPHSAFTLQAFTWHSRSLHLRSRISTPFMCLMMGNSGDELGGVLSIDQSTGIGN